MNRCRAEEQAPEKRDTRRKILGRPSLQDPDDLISVTSVVCGLHIEQRGSCKRRDELFRRSAEFGIGNALAEELDENFRAV